MGRIVTPQKGRISGNNDLQDLVTNIIQGQSVLVLGHEHMLKEDKSGGDILRQMAADFFDYKHEIDKNFNSSYSSFNEYYYRGASIKQMKEEIAESLDASNYIFDEDDYSPEVMRLLRKKCFRMVLTTTFDYYAETMLRKIWGDELRVISIFDQRNDINQDETWQTDIRPTLYYVFGRADRNKEYVVVEKDAMMVIKKWLSNPPINLMTYLNNKSILALGTKFDDWLFRFFWFALHRNIDSLSNGQVSISLTPDSEVDQRLKYFLDNERIPYGSMDTIIGNILSDYDNKESEYQRMYGQNTDVFISYSDSSYETVRHLFYSLTEAGFKAWFDKIEMHAGDSHKSVIVDAINKCKVFIPVITNSVREVLSEDISQFHYFRDVEWRTAMSRLALNSVSAPIRVMPFCMEGLTVKDLHFNESQLDFRDFISVKSAGDNRTEANYRKFIVDLKDALR
jgi:hypothetical protein